MNKIVVTGLTLIVGAVIGAGVVAWLLPTASSPVPAEKKPLYWVAPMDPSYRRDKPGKSPMGMDLIPVYEEQSAKESPGTVRIVPDVENNIGVRIAKVEFAGLDQRIDTVGYVQFNEDELRHVHPRVEGWVETLHVKAEGASVRKGEPVYSLYSPVLVNAQREFILAHEQGRPDLLAAARQRLVALAFPIDKIDSLIKTGQPLRTVTIAAPLSGVVENLGVREGVFIKPGQTVVSLGSLDKVWVIAEIFEASAQHLSLHDEAIISSDAMPDVRWSGRIDYIYPVLDNKTRTVRVRIVVDNDGKQLKPNMFVRVYLNDDQPTPRMVVPREAVIRTGAQDRVVVALGDGRFKSVAVKVGQVGGNKIEILDGLMPDDEVVISAQFLLDSESSKTSDFIRMQHSQDQATGPLAVWVKATITSLMPEHKMVSLQHDEVPDWGWPSMTMDFSTADDVDLTSLREGMVIHVELKKADDGKVVVNAVHIPEQKNIDGPPSKRESPESEYADPDTEVDHSHH
ncbi:efflux RND transporter periplasmic adaptor subunit [Permianibacter aggregans]|uniref:Cu(I)/Ag(I) efflux system membrane fusion protein n=1 Tax=Permianibacter aggregans TaxID=1510150 RepID=A0A4R6UE08_9GAMM|nr:efflux RND transporter periplasmic adaptor subunit [Permianibacter aggregans]QGX38184.1 efflux RND transporter periplasmic adaptor subunit [Permianibacter aggregans]TDQ44968.1 Cu(I)/Ag(I) efflux system membrane fusion protein [Permianibacter aggregans]